MAEETIEETTEQSWGSKISDSFSSAGIGLTITFACIALLFYNEHNLVTTRKALTESESIVVDLPCPPLKVDSAFNGNLVHVSGLATTNSVLGDNLLGLNLTKTLKMKRDVQMYQWREKESTSTTKRTGGKSETTTTYSYVKEWRSFPIDTSTFYKRDGHENPPFPFEGTVQISDGIKLGAFDLPDSIVSMIYDYQPLSATPSVEAVPMTTTGGKPITPFEEEGVSGFYIGNVTEPDIGDLKVTFLQTPDQKISIVAKQLGVSLEEYTASNGKNVLLVARGNKTIDEMFTGAQNDITSETWIIRFVCLIAMWFGLSLIADPLVALLDVLPLLGNCFQYVNFAIAGVVAFCLWIVTVAMAWMFFRPFFSVCVFAAVAALVFGVRWLAQNSKKKKKGYEEIPTADPEAGTAVVE